MTPAANQDKNPMNTAEFSKAEMAWMAQQYLAGRRQSEIGDELGFTASVICGCLSEFGGTWGTYGEQRRELLQHALWAFSGEPKHPGTGGSYLLYWEARREHAARLREEKLTYRAIGARMGITAACAKILAMRGERELTRLRGIKRIPIK